MNRKITNYLGDDVRLVCDESLLMETIYETMVEPFEEHIVALWGTGNMAEERAKNYLSYVGSLMIRKPDKHDIISDRK